MGRTPIRKTEAAPAHGRSRLRKNASQRSILDIPSEIVNTIKEDFGCDLQWVTYEVLGKGEPAMRQDFEINGWQAVTQDMFGRLLDGMYMKKGEKGEIVYGGMVLMERPYELTEEAKAEEAAARIGAMRAQENMIKGGAGIKGLASGFEGDHASALSKTIFKRSVERPVDIPTE